MADEQTIKCPVINFSTQYCDKLFLKNKYQKSMYVSVALLPFLHPPQQIIYFTL